MRTIHYATATIFTAASLMLSGCTLKQMIKMAKEQELTVKPSPLELHGDSVMFTTSAKLPVGMMKPSTKYSVEFSYKPTNAEAFKVGEMVFDATKYANAKTQPEISQRFSFGFQESWDRGQLYVQGFASKGEKVRSTAQASFADFGPEGSGAGIITTSRLALPSYLANYTAHNYDGREEYDPVKVDFFFEKGSSMLRTSERRSNRAKELESYIAGQNPTRAVNISGMHSPEGPTSINTKLANERPKVMEDFYRKTAERYKYGEAIKDVNFVVKPVVENWTEFKALLRENTKISDSQKNEVLSIVDGAGDFVSKELKLQTLPYYNALVRELYPPLRAAKAEILKIREKLSEPEIMVLAQKVANGQESADKLTHEELAYAAFKTPSLEEREKMYQAAIRKNDKFDSYNNLGAVYLEMAKKQTSVSARDSYIDKAITQFELSLKKQESPEAYINLAGAKLMRGDKAAAMEALNKASGNSTGTVANSVNAMKGYLAIQEGSYNDAIQALSSGGSDPVVLYNRALAYLLQASYTGSGDFARAQAAFDEAIRADENNAYAHYGAAVTAARMKNADKVATHLATAARLDSKLKERAVKDLEFLSYWKDQKFIDALK